MEEPPSKDEIIKSMQACYENASRLLGEVETLEFEKVLASRFFLSVIAQEECSKGFLLFLVSAKIIPWDNAVFRATKSHECKQLLGMVIEFLNPDWDNFEKRMNELRKDIDKGIFDHLPAYVADAINVFRHEKIGRWRSKNWFLVEDPNWDKKAMSVAEGKQDQHKQDSLYVRLNKNGEVVSRPSAITIEEANEEYERGKRFASFLKSLIVSGMPNSIDGNEVMEAFQTVFSEFSGNH